MYKAIEVHPTSTRKALQMPPKDWDTIQESLKNLGLKGKNRNTPLSYSLNRRCYGCFNSSSPPKRLKLSSQVTTNKDT